MVEDISVFTGLDAGLVDVMITQHTGGELQKSLCRMTSVVGVTDGYYKDTLSCQHKTAYQAPNHTKCRFHRSEQVY